MPRLGASFIRSHRIFAFVVALTLLGLGVLQANAQSNEWAWMSGEVTAGSFGVYGTLGIAAAANAPSGRAESATWTDNKGNIWLFGGDGVDS